LVGRQFYLASGIKSAAFMLAPQLGKLGEICALATDAKTKTDTMPRRVRTRAADRNMENPAHTPV
jgi:hypothetical protein